jgi:hypothetical protein
LPAHSPADLVTISGTTRERRTPLWFDLSPAAHHWLDNRSTRMSNLFESVQLGSLALANRVFMAPLTRSRADANGVPGELAATYYSQRASAGLIVTEATQISPWAKGTSILQGFILSSRCKRGAEFGQATDLWAYRNGAKIDFSRPGKLPITRVRRKLPRNLPGRVPGYALVPGSQGGEAPDRSLEMSI